MRRQIVLSLFSALLLTAQVAALDSPDEKGSKNPSEPRKIETRLRLGDIHVGAGFLDTSGYPFLPWVGSLYGPQFYDPLLPYPPACSVDRSGVDRDHFGRVELENVAADAQVFIDGGLAGTGSDLKSFYLKPGAYPLSIKRPGYESFNTKLYVLSRKTLHVDVPIPSEVKP